MMIRIRHLWPVSVADAHVHCGGYNRQVELIVQPANDCGFQWNDVVHIPGNTCRVGSCDAERVGFSLHKVEKFIVEWLTRLNFSGTPFCAKDSGFQPDGVATQCLANVRLAPARDCVARHQGVSWQDGQASAGASAKPSDVSFGSTWWCGSINHHKASEFFAAEVKKLRRSSRSRGFCKQAAAGLGVAIHEGHAYHGSEIPAVACAVPLAHGYLPVSPGAIAGQNLKAAKAHSWCNLGCIFNTQASTRRAVSASQISNFGQRLTSAIAFTNPAPSFAFALGQFLFNCGEFAKPLTSQIESCCHLGAFLSRIKLCLFR